MRPSLALLAAASLAGILAGIGLASAQPSFTPEQKARARAVMASCRPDYDRLCSGVRPGEGRVLACFQDHRAELSDACRSALAGAAASRK